LRLGAHGIEIELPRGWEGRIYRRPGADPTLHAANFPLPARDGDFGSQATALMPSGGALLVLKEYRPGPHLVPGTGLFGSRSIPRLHPGGFHPRALQVGRLRQAGLQHFFTSGGRPFCLYAVIKTAPLGARAAAETHNQIGAVNRVLASLRLQARGP
jgi:hypothetical protein